jgi:hypothetical protein
MERDLRRYQKGKIYSIRSHQTDKYYIGSTCLGLCQRLHKHRKNYKSYLNDKGNYISSIEILKYEDHYIELLEDFSCKSKRELEKREGELQRQYKNDIVNNYYAHNTPEQLKEQQKIYQEINKNKISENKKKYYEVNKEKILEEKKMYRDKNREKINELQKQNYQKKKEEKRYGG